MYVQKKSCSFTSSEGLTGSVSGEVQSLADLEEVAATEVVTV